MKANLFTLTRTTRFATGTLLLGTGILAQGADKAPATDALPAPPSALTSRLPKTVRLSPL